MPRIGEGYGETVSPLPAHELRHPPLPKSAFFTKPSTSV